MGCNVFPWNTILYHPSGREQIELNFSFSPYYWNIEAQQRHLFFPRNCLFPSCWHIVDSEIFKYWCWHDNTYFCTTSACQKLKKLQRKAHDKLRNLLPLHFLTRNTHWSTTKTKRKEIEMLDFERSMEVSIWIHLSSLASKSSEWLQETTTLPVYKAWDQQLPLQSVYNL